MVPSAFENFWASFFSANYLQIQAEKMKLKNFLKMMVQLDSSTLEAFSEVL